MTQQGDTQWIDLTIEIGFRSYDYIFERIMDHFINAALFNEVDHIESVSSMVGRVINI